MAGWHIIDNKDFSWQCGRVEPVMIVPQDENCLGSTDTAPAENGHNYLGDKALAVSQRILEPMLPLLPEDWQAKIWRPRTGSETRHLHGKLAQASHGGGLLVRNHSPPVWCF